MIAEDLPSRFQLKTTGPLWRRGGLERFGCRSTVPSCFRRALHARGDLQSMEVVGEDLKGATIHMHRVGGVFRSSSSTASPPAASSRRRTPN